MPSLIAAVMFETQTYRLLASKYLCHTQLLGDLGIPGVYCINQDSHPVCSALAPAPESFS